MKNKQTFLPKKTGFKIPETYFADFHIHLQEKLTTEQFPKEKIFSGFEIPENYFEDFHVNRSEKKEPKVISLFGKRNLQHAVAIAAVLAIIFSIFTKNPLQKNIFHDIEPQSIGVYLENHPTEFPFLDDMLFEDNNLAEPKFSNLDEEILFDYLSAPTSELSFAKY